MSTGGGFVLEKDKVVPGWERVSGETDGWVVFFFYRVGKKSLYAKNERLLAG